jgi:hypothetical protein
MTLSEAWVNFPQNEKPYDTSYEECWKAYFWQSLGWGFQPCGDPACESCSAFQAEVKRITGGHGPVTEATDDLPQWLLDLWDGYEPVKKVMGKKKVKRA